MNHILPRMPDPSQARGRLAWIHRQRGRRDEAVEEMAAAVVAAPWFLWGWIVLMGWLMEDQKWDLALRLLCPIPPEVCTDTDFRVQRLFVLENAGLAPEELDAEWNNLLRDSPQNVSLHAQRYDVLRARGRAREAATVLAAIRPVEPGNPYVLARVVEMLAEEGKKGEAIDALFSIWFAEGEGSAWPSQYAWKAAKSARIEDDAYREARWRLARGLRPTPEALSIMAAHATGREFLGGKKLQPHWRTWFPGRGAREV